MAQDEVAIPDAVEAWVDLTANDLYADFCNHGHAIDVLARAIRLGYLRGVMRGLMTAPPRVDFDAVEATIRAKADAQP